MSRERALGAFCEYLEPKAEQQVFQDFQIAFDGLATNLHFAPVLRSISRCTTSSSVGSFWISSMTICFAFAFASMSSMRYSGVAAYLRRIAGLRRSTLKASGYSCVHQDVLPVPRGPRRKK